MKRIGEGRENFSEEKLFPPFPKPHPSLSKDFRRYRICARRLFRHRLPSMPAWERMPSVGVASCAFRAKKRFRIRLRRVWNRFLS